MLWPLLPVAAGGTVTLVPALTSVFEALIAALVITVYFFNWETFTPSVSNAPAATFCKRLSLVAPVPVPLPTDTAPVAIAPVSLELYKNAVWL